MLFDPTDIVSSTIAGTNSLVQFIALPILSTWFTIAIVTTGLGVVAYLLVRRSIWGSAKILTKRK